MKILVSGANGFIGSALCEEALSRGWSLVACVRQSVCVEQTTVGDIGAQTSWQEPLKGVDVVVHLAAQASVQDITSLYTVNVDAATNLFRQAVAAGVTRFVFMSSAKVHGDVTKGSSVLKEESPLLPGDPYASSKCEAEQQLISLAAGTATELVIVRPTLVYGRGVKGNFKLLMGLLEKGLPLPFGLVSNERSFVAVDNLVDFICLCSIHPKAAGDVFLVSDIGVVSTPELLKRIAVAVGRRVTMLPIPVSLMSGVAALLGKQRVADSLFGSFRVNPSKAIKKLGWKPIVSMRDVLSRM